MKSLLSPSCQAPEIENISYPLDSNKIGTVLDFRQIVAEKLAEVPEVESIFINSIEGGPLDVIAVIDQDQDEAYDHIFDQERELMHILNQRPFDLHIIARRGRNLRAILSGDTPIWTRIPSVVEYR